MNTYADKLPENKNLSVANEQFESKSSSGKIIQKVDKQPEAGVQRTLQNMADNSPQVKKIAQLQAMADSSLNQLIPVRSPSASIPKYQGEQISTSLPNPAVNDPEVTQLVLEDPKEGNLVYEGENLIQIWTVEQVTEGSIKISRVPKFGQKQEKQIDKAQWPGWSKKEESGAALSSASARSEEIKEVSSALTEEAKVRIVSLAHFGVEDVSECVLMQKGNPPFIHRAYKIVSTGAGTYKVGGNAHYNAKTSQFLYPGSGWIEGLSEWKTPLSREQGQEIYDAYVKVKGPLPCTES